MGVADLFGRLYTATCSLPYDFQGEGGAIIIAFVLAQMTVVAVFLCSIAGFMGSIHKYLELTSHFKLQYR